MLFGSFLTNVGLTAALFSGGSMAGIDYPQDSEPMFDETWSSGYGETKVVRIALKGLIMRGGNSSIF